jgi:hypothetical protein
VIEFDAETGWLSPGGPPREIGIREMGAALIQTVIQKPGVTRPELLESVKGRKEYKLDVLRRLTAPGSVLGGRTPGEAGRASALPRAACAGAQRPGVLATALQDAGGSPVGGSRGGSKQRHSAHEAGTSKHGLKTQ